jgi:hypothetical protein
VQYNEGLLLTELEVKYDAFEFKEDAPTKNN